VIEVDSYLAGFEIGPQHPEIERAPLSAAGVRRLLSVVETTKKTITLSINGTKKETAQNGLFG